VLPYEYRRTCGGRSGCWLHLLPRLRLRLQLRHLGQTLTAGEAISVEQGGSGFPQVGLNSLTTAGFWAGEGGGVLDREIAARGFGEGGIGGKSHDDPGAAARIANPQCVQKSRAIQRTAGPCPGLWC